MFSKIGCTFNYPFFSTKLWNTSFGTVSKQNLHIIESVSIIATMHVKITFFTSFHTRSRAEKLQRAGVS